MRPEFQRIQQRFADYLRNPQDQPPPEGIESRRLKVYRELFYDNVEEFLSGAFPVLRKLYQDEDWHELARKFFHCHACKTPYFLKIAEEFLDYLRNEHQTRTCDPAFLEELAHYEWLELSLDVDPREIPQEGVELQGDLLAAQPLLNPLLYLLSYRFPVHRIGPQFRPEEPSEQPVYLIVYRDRADKVRFIESSSTLARMLELIQANGAERALSGAEVLQALAEESACPAEELPRFHEQGLAALEMLRRKDVLLGVASKTHQN